MSCLGATGIARVVTGGESPPHLRDCIACRRELERQRTVRDALRETAPPRLPEVRRREIKAETMAVAMIAVSAKSRAAWMGAAAAIAATAAIAVFAVATRSSPGVTIAEPELPISEVPAHSVRIAAYESPPPVRGAPDIDARPGTVLSHRPGAQLDVITLVDGTIEIDTRGRRDADVRVGNTTVRVEDATVRIRASKHSIVRVEVVIGAARLVGPDQRVTLERGVVWTTKAPVTSQALASFRDAWVALRAGDNRNAIVLFDRATDASVAEEATYWSAVAAKRAGDEADAKQRFTDFLSRFPDSPYAAQARRAIANE